MKLFRLCQPRQAMLLNEKQLDVEDNGESDLYSMVLVYFYSEFSIVPPTVEAVLL